MDEPLKLSRVPLGRRARKPIAGQRNPRRPDACSADATSETVLANSRAVIFDFGRAALCLLIKDYTTTTSPDYCMAATLYCVRQCRSL